jgi:NAD(P)-dependent dehydrogenase (short-subunit alcohol dehydrogenase family)
VLLANKTAIVYGASGAIGSEVSRVFAREGAHVSLAGRAKQPLETVADAIRSTGGAAEAATVDVLERSSVEAHASSVARSRGGIDIVFNATSNDDVQGTALVDMSNEDFMRPVIKAVAAHYTIATTVAEHMKARGQGVILVMAGGREAIPNLGGSHVAWSALAGLCRQLASELGADGIRVAWLLSPGSPDSTSPEASGLAVVSENSGDPSAATTLLGRRPTLNDVANVAAFLSSDWARTMTATELNLTGGAVVD